MTEIQISKWGNSSAIRLPKSVMEELGFKPGQTVQISVQDGKGIIEATAGPKKFSLEWILAEMDRLGPANAPDTVEWGPDTAGERIDDEYSRGEISEPVSAS